MRGEIEQRLGLLARVPAADDRLAEDEDPDQLALREEGDGDDPLQQREVSGHVGIGEIGQTGGPSLRREPLGKPRRSREPHGPRDCGRQAAMGHDAIGAIHLVGQQQRRASRTQQLADPLEEDLESAWPVEAGGEQPAEALEDARERRRLPGRGRGRARGGDLGQLCAQGVDLAQ